LQQQHLDGVLWSFTNSVVFFEALLPMFKGWHFHGHCPEWKLPHAGQYTDGFGLNTSVGVLHGLIVMYACWVV
jgi:hypothetical protein